MTRVFYKCQVKDCGKEITTTGDMTPIMEHIQNHEAKKLDAPVHVT